MTQSMAVPRSAADVTALIREANAEGRAVYPRGGNTLADYGLPVARSGMVIDLRQLNQVDDYPARDMTITVGAGITVAELQKALAAEGQTLPVDIPLPERSTIGGALAANLSGPRRLGYGTLRDYLIGVSFINDQGEQCKAGGRVVKNVAGYDLCKLLIGSWGTLGIITQATLKVRPRAEGRAVVVARVPVSKLEAILTGLHETNTRPVAVSVQGDQSQANLARLLVCFEEKGTTVSWQLNQLREEFAGMALAELATHRNAAAEEAIQELTDILLPPAPPAWVWKASVPASQVAAFIGEAEMRLLRWVAHASSGIVIGQADGTCNAAEIQRLRDLAGKRSGSLTVWRAPEAHRHAEVLWGTVRPELAMMQRVKAALDPKGLFNPGRYCPDPRMSSPRSGLLY